MTLKVTETPPQTLWTKREQVAQRKQEVDHRGGFNESSASSTAGLIRTGPGSSGAAPEEPAQSSRKQRALPQLDLI